jgi:endoribonuclease Dicer
MGSNERLCDCATITGIDKFILLTPLSRAEWQPCGLVSMNPDGIADNCFHLNAPSLKVCADVVEALIGLVFLHNGLEDANSVVCELGISFNYGDADETSNRSWTKLTVNPKLVDFASSFLGVQGFHFPQLLIEATTHQSCLHTPVPSYQRLEWVGDAVLCLAIREWLFRLDDSIPVPRLVVFETTLECNESLAFLGTKKGVCQFIDHRDSRLPNRFAMFQRDLTGRGLWCTG